MRKKLTFLLLLLCLCTVSFASGVALDGLLGQWQYDLHVNDEALNGSAATYGAGANLSFPVGGPLAVGIDAAVDIIKGSEEGSLYVVGGNNLFAGATVQYQFPFPGGSAYIAAGGGMKAFQLEIGENGQNNTRQYSLTGALLGGGFAYEASPKLRIVGDARYLLPFSSLQKMDDQGFHDEGEAKGGLISLSAGAQLSILPSALVEVRGRFGKDDFSGSIGEE